MVAEGKTYTKNRCWKKKNLCRRTRNKCTQVNRLRGCRSHWTPSGVWNRPLLIRNAGAVSSRWDVPFDEELSIWLWVVECFNRILNEDIRSRDPAPLLRSPPNRPDIAWVICDHEVEPRKKTSSNVLVEYSTSFLAGYFQDVSRLSTLRRAVMLLPGGVATPSARPLLLRVCRSQCHNSSLLLSAFGKKGTGMWYFTIWIRYSNKSLF